MNDLAGQPVIGIVGGVGAGKSRVAQLLGEAGFAVVDGDAIGREVLARADVRAALHDRWGERIVTPEGRIDRQALGAIVFGDEAELEALNRVTAVRIREEIRSQIARARADGARGVAVDAAILFEAGWDDLCTHCVFVDAADEVRRTRVREGRGWDDETWRRREKVQISLDCKRGKCCYIIDNSSGESHLREQVRALIHSIAAASDFPLSDTSA